MSRPAPGMVHRLNPRNLDWAVVIAIVGMHLVALAAVWPGFFSWTGLIVFGVMVWVTGGLGITLCFHRLLTHRSFRTPRWLEYGLTLLGCLAWQGGPVNWVGVHRLHHKYSDGDEDPHSPKHGFTWAHMLWVLHKQVGQRRGADAANDLLRDPVMRWIDRLFWVPQVLLAGALFGLGCWWGGPAMGASWVIWGVALRTVVVFHGTWFVNSAAHTWGYQNYPESGDHSTNLWWVALVSFGEGWHNNHHAYPRSAAHGLRRLELDPTYWVIRVLSWVGLAREVRVPREDQMPDAPSRESVPPTVVPSAAV